MKINKFQYSDTSAVQVYLSKDEYANDTIQIELEEVKKKYKSVGIFVSGESNFKNSVTNIISDFKKDSDLG